MSEENKLTLDVLDKFIEEVEWLSLCSIKGCDENK